MSLSKKQLAIGIKENSWKSHINKVSDLNELYDLRIKFEEKVKQKERLYKNKNSKISAELCQIRLDYVNERIEILKRYSEYLSE